MRAMTRVPGPMPSRFGAGHTLTLTVPPERPEPTIAFVKATFPGAVLREMHGSRLRFQLPPGGDCTLARVFRELAAQGEDHGVEDFSVSQTTLEEVMSGARVDLKGGAEGRVTLADMSLQRLCVHCQVFLHFSKDQGEEEGCCRETGAQEVSTPGLQQPKRVSRFLEDPSSAETVL